MKLSMIAAMDNNGLIGNGAALPWPNLPADMQHFRTLTSGKPVIMGQKTYESIGRLLPGRENIIMTLDQDFAVEGAVIVHSPKEVLDHVASSAEAFVIGGAMTYKIFEPFADTLYLTYIDGEFSGDVHFPITDLSGWHIVSEDRRHKDEANAYDMRFVTYEKTR